MPNLNSEGALYFHMFTFTFLAIIMAAVKNADLNDLTASPDMNADQVMFIAAALILGVILFLAFLVARAASIRDIPFGRVGSLGLLLVFIGLWGVGWTLGFESFTETDVTKNSDDMLQIVLFSILPIFGSYLVCAVKFSTTRQDQEIARMVRKEIQEAVASNNVLCPNCEKVVSAFAAGCKYCGMDFSKPEKEDSEDILVAVPDPDERPAPKPRPSAPAPAGDSTIFDCSKCGKKLKVSNPKRPLTIKCPSCKSVETLR
jgi:hypothetical protein